MAEDRHSTSSRAARLGVLNASDWPLVAPSLLSCDFGRMVEELAAVEKAGAKALHLDVMDGHFVPNLSYGPPVITDWRKYTDLPFDTHLMISEPGRYLDDFVKAGCDVIIFHIEVEPEPSALARRIRGAGCQASIALNPPTPVSAVLPFLDEVDSVLVMSVMPGFGGQKFDGSVLEKVKAIHAARPDLRISIDGGIKPDTAELATTAGVSQLVAGSAVFRKDGNYEAALDELVRGAKRGDTAVRP